MCMLSFSLFVRSDLDGKRQPKEKGQKQEIELQSSLGLRRGNFKRVARYQQSNSPDNSKVPGFDPNKIFEPSFKKISKSNIESPSAALF